MGLRLIVSPAKKLVPCEDFAPAGQPVFLGSACELTQALRALDPSQLQALWRTSDALTQGCLAQLARWRPDAPEAAPAVMSYWGIQYQALAPRVLERPALEYLAEHLRILSGLYGWLRPFDAVAPYRLEMQAKLAMPGCRTLYDYWQDALAAQAAAELGVGAAGLASAERRVGAAGREAPAPGAGADPVAGRRPGGSGAGVGEPSPAATELGVGAAELGVGAAEPAPSAARSEAVLVNLASQEYAKAVVPRLPAQVRVITCLFGERREGRLLQRATQAKAARGSFVRWCAERQVTRADQLPGFDQGGYRLDRELTTPDRLVFVHKPQSR